MPLETPVQRRIARFGIFEADLDSRQLTKSGFRIRLQDQPFQILALLLERKDLVVTREELKEKLWPGNTFVEFDDGLNTAIKKLRAALGDSAENPRFVETVPRVGYRFVAPVSVLRPAVASNVEPEVAVPAVAESGESPLSSGLATSDVAAPAVIPRPDVLPRRVALTSRWRLAAWIAVGMFLLTAGLSIRMRSKSAASASPRSSIQAIAVLPLLNVSTDSAQEYFADGMTDEIITDLAKLAGPKVISRTSAMQYKGTHKTIPEIARELQVGAVLEGSVERSGDRIRVRMQLIDASTDQHLWAESYDRQLKDVLLLEAQLAQDIAQQIQLRLTQQQQQSLAYNRPLNPRAFQDYLQGRQYWAMRTSESVKKAVEYFGQAIQEDPNDARSYAGLAQCYIVLPIFSGMPQAEAFMKARDAAAKALALDNSLAEAHLSIAEIRLYMDWDFPGAEREFKATLDLNPNYATGHQWYGEFLSLMARHDEAIGELQTALALDPLSAVMHHQAGQTFQQARQYDKALEQYHEALRIDPNFLHAYEMTSWVLRRQGNYRESIRTSHISMQMWDPTGKMSGLVDEVQRSYTSRGKSGFLRASIKLHQSYPRPEILVARDYADLGEPEAALSLLELAYQKHNSDIVLIRTDPEFDSLRADPRFQELIRKVGFPQQPPA
jgi:TolB-like protein/DNA-binding winged helix-turn-helix (wHTH) protein/Tfp pilus assembly protein PilF